MSVAEDRIAIVELLHRYAHTIDTGNLDGLAVMLARTRLSEKVGKVASESEGSADIVQWWRDHVILYDGIPRTNHLVHNPLVEIAADGRTAQVVNYMQLLQQVPPDFPLQTIGTGRYRSLVAKDEDGWYFKEITIEGWLFGDLSHHVRGFD